MRQCVGDYCFHTAYYSRWSSKWLSPVPGIPVMKMAIHHQRMQQLRERYPYQFARLFAYGLSVEPGWLGIIESTCTQIDAVLEAGNVPRQTFSWNQIKEKLGGLRMYWDRGWHLPVGKRFDDLDEPEFVFPETMPEDPEASDFESFERYLASDRAREWDALHMIPNPDLANRPRVLSRTFDGIVSMEFEGTVTDEEIEAIVRAVANVMLVPEAVTQKIREIIEAAEDEAARTCQFCGAPGEHVVWPDTWHVTACAAHGTREGATSFLEAEG